MHETRQSVSGELSCTRLEIAYRYDKVRELRAPRCQAPARFDGVHRKETRSGGELEGATPQREVGESLGETL
jgi:hypothetical protein